MNHVFLQVWQFLTKGPVFSSPCFTPDQQRLLCGSHDGHLYCLSCTDGSLVWKFPTAGKVYSTPFVFDGSSVGRRGVLVALASTDGTVWILDGEDGRMLTCHTLPGELFSSAVVYEQSVVVGCRNDDVYCLRLTVKEKSWERLNVHFYIKRLNNTCLLLGASFQNKDTLNSQPEPHALKPTVVLPSFSHLTLCPMYSATFKMHFHNVQMYRLWLKRKQQKKQTCPFSSNRLLQFSWLPENPGVESWWKQHRCCRQQLNTVLHTTIRVIMRPWDLGSDISF